MYSFKTVIRWLYWIQVILFVLILSGDRYRGEVSLWVMDEYLWRLERHGMSDAIFVAYVYMIVYSSAFACPYKLLLMYYEPPMPESRLQLFLLSIWFAFSVFLFVRPVFEFFRNIPWWIWNGWLIILWGVATFHCVVLGWACHRVWVGRKRSP